ncbi:MAG: hypothetical protein JST90_01825 [Bacteroidetes bacterium]|nr:hypothetical protein [Bacteroidota bacterium]
MKYLTLLLPICLLMGACHARIQQTDTISERGPDSIYAAYLVMARCLPDSMGKIAPYVATERDSGTIYEVLDSPYLAIGRLIDTTHVFAVSCRNVNDDSAALGIYSYDNGWKAARKFTVPFGVQFISYVNTDTDAAHLEIMLSSTGTLVRGGRHRLYRYYAPSGYWAYGGEFFCGPDEVSPETTGSGCKIDAAHNRIWVTSEGVDGNAGRSTYIWRGTALILLSEVQIDKLPQGRVLSYSINADSCICNEETTVFTEPLNEKSPRYKKYWDHFFDLK